MILYNSATQTLAIRLIQKRDTAAEEAAADTSDPLEVDVSAEEKFLLIPIKSGVPTPPADCANEEDYYKAVTTLNGDFVLDNSLQVACEGTAETCAAVGLSSTPTTSTSCETVNLYPAGDIKTASGTVSCEGKIQMLVTDRPNLVFIPGSSAGFYGIEGRTAVLAATPDSNASRIFTASGAIIRLNKSGKRFTLTEGGILGLPRGQRLHMYGPTTIDTGTGAVIMTNGGELRDSTGVASTTYGANASVAPNTTWPYVISVNRVVEMPQGYLLPTQPSPYVRGPVSP
jgi:hypothetical protein